MSYWVDQIRLYGAVQQYSAERHEQGHQTIINDSWNASNHNLNILTQVITFQRRILFFHVRELNLQALTQRRETNAAAFKVLPPGADQAAPLSPQSYAQPECMGPQNRRDGKHPNTMIKDFKSLLENTPDVTHSMAMYSSTCVFIKRKHHNKSSISDEQLQAMELSIYHGLKVQVEGFDGERMSRMGPCTRSPSWREEDPRNDWVWLMQQPGRWYGTLHGSLPWQLQRLFTIQFLNNDGAFIETWLAVALTTIPENSSNLDPISKFVQVRKAPAAVASHVFSRRNIIGCAHGIPEIATTVMTGDGQNGQWIVNSLINLATWNVVYNQFRENCTLHSGRRSARSDFRSITHHIAIPMQARTQSTHSDVWSQMATTPE